MTDLTKLENVRIGISGDSGFCMTPFINGLPNSFIADRCEGYDGGKIEIWGCIIPESDNEHVNMFSLNEGVFTVQSFSNEFILEMQKLYSLSNYLLDLDKTKYVGKNCSISELMILTKIKGKEVYSPPIDNLNIYGVGNIHNHPYIKNGFGHTSKIKSFCPSEDLFYSKRRPYSVLSLSDVYKSFLQEIVSELEKIFILYKCNFQI